MDKKKTIDDLTKFCEQAGHKLFPYQKHLLEQMLTNPKYIFFMPARRLGLSSVEKTMNEFRALQVKKEGE